MILSSGCVSSLPAHLGQYPPAQAIAIARGLVRRGVYDLTPNAAGELAELLNSLGRAGPDDVREALEAIMRELDTSHYRPPRDPERVPGIPFIWDSRYFGKPLYFKFKLVGSKKKPRMVIFSCHPPDFSRVTFEP
jgi:hypothetical protein